MDHLYCGSEFSSKGSLFTIKQLKNMLLSHLDLIQEQNEELIRKDKKISILEKENLTLQQRIQRITRRGSNGSKHSVPEIESTVKKTIIIHPPYKNSNKLQIQQQHQQHQQQQSPGKINKIILQRTNNFLSHDEFQLKQDFEDRNDTSEDEILIKKSGSAQLLERFGIVANFISATKPYVLNEWKNCEVADEEILQKNFDEPSVNLEIPRWVEKELPPASQDTLAINTEDISDEVFLKRHQKFEISEKRRKKWDYQRIREQKTVERLRKRHLKEEEGSSKIPKIITSFFPNCDTIKYIQITEDYLPVLAFGENIPKLPPKDFSLDWLSNDNYGHNIYSITSDRSNNTSNSLAYMKTKFMFSSNSHKLTTDLSKDIKKISK